MTQENLNTLGGSIDEGEVAIIIGAITTANLFPGEFPTASPALGQPITSLKDGNDVVVKIGDDVAARFTPNERAQTTDDVTYTATGNDQVKEILLDMGMIEDPAEGPLDDVIEGDAAEDAAPAGDSADPATAA